VNIFEQLRRDEGCVLHAYLDTLGFWTIGDGQLIDPRKGATPPPEMTWPDGPGNITVNCTITQDVADRLLNESVAKTQAQMDKMMPWWQKLDEVRQAVLLNMAFNLGVDGLMRFYRTISLVQAGLYEAAGQHMLQLPWAYEVGNKPGQRADRLAQQMSTGVWV